MFTEHVHWQRSKNCTSADGFAEGARLWLSDRWLAMAPRRQYDGLGRSDLAEL